MIPREDPFDIVVIGAGIHGAGMAQAAAAAGYSVLVLEQYSQLARGTSSRSSKLIHGGLRYLESGQFHLVWECLKERRILLRIAPQLVHLIPFFIPIYPWSIRQKTSLKTGLALYSLIGGLGKNTRFKTLPPSQWQRLDGLQTKNLQTVLQYYDAQTDDVALTNAVMNSAIVMGAELKLGAKVDHIQLHDKGCMVHYRQANHEFDCLARVAVNAAGPWANTILKCVTPHQNSIPYDLIQGTHLVLPGSLHAGSYYVEAPQDGRGVFIMPWGGNTLLGTTERHHKHAPETIEPNEEEVEYLLKIIHHYFPQKKVARGDILRTFAGARVLPSNRNSASDRSRETSLIVDRSPHPRLISIIGGKLTVYRATAQKSLQKIVSSLPHKSPLADTEFIPLSPVDELHCRPPQLG